MNGVAKVDSERGRALGTSPMNWLRGEIDRMFDDFGYPGRSLFNFGSRAIGPEPAMELVDRGKDYCLTAELPGLTEKDVTVEVADGVLTIAGEKNETSEHKDGSCLMTERRYGAFRRQFALPADADADAIDAKVKHGVLTVTVAKDEKAAPRARKIEVQS